MSRLQQDGEDKPPIKLSKESEGCRRKSTTRVTNRNRSEENSLACHGVTADGSTKNSSRTEDGCHQDGSAADVKELETREQLAKAVSDIEKAALPGSASPNVEDEPIGADRCKPSGNPDVDQHSYPEGGLRAWSVVFGSLSGMTASFGLLNSVGTFQAYISANQLSHYSPSSVGWVFSIFAFLTFFCGVQIGPVFDAKGARWLVFAGTVCLFVGMMGVAESTKLWHFILTFSLTCGVGSSLIFTPAVGAVAHFFSCRRAAATGIATTGGSLGGIIFPLMLQRLFPLVGFRWATRILAFILLFLLAIANLLIRTRLTPPKNAANRIGQNLWPDFRIFRHSVFALTTVAVFFIEWALFIPITYISSYAIAHNVSPTFSYQLLAILNVGSFFGRWAPGYIADRFGRFNTMIATVALCLVSVLGLWLTCDPGDGRGGLAQICIFALVFGFASGSNISLTPVCVGQLCDTKVFGRWYASMYTIVSFGCLTGIPIAGQILASSDGRYTSLIGFTGACYGVGLACFVWARIINTGWGLKKVY